MSRTLDSFLRTEPVTRPITYIAITLVIRVVVAGLAVLVEVAPRRSFVGEPQGARPTGKPDYDGPDRCLCAVFLKPLRGRRLGESCMRVWCVFAHRTKCASRARCAIPSQTDLQMFARC